MTGKIWSDGYNPIQELGLYYLQSRYYNPTWGRFINADALVSTGQGILGNNMFAYCANNPVLRLDSSGLDWTSFWRRVKDEIIEEKEDASDNPNVTTTVGLTANGAFGVGGSASVGLTYDTKGNIGIAGTGNVGGGFPGAGVGAYVTVSNAPTIYKQGGTGAVVGASGGPGVIAIGGEYCMMIDDAEGKVYHGATVAATIGLYPTCVEVHGEVGYTEVVGINIYDVLVGFVDLLIWVGEVFA